MRIPRFPSTGLLVLLLAVSLAPSGHAGEQTVRLEDCPAAVQAAFSDHAAGGKILEIERETEDGIVVYEAEIETADGKRIEVEVDADGKILEVENSEEEDDDDEEDNDDDDRPAGA